MYFNRFIYFLMTCDMIFIICPHQNEMDAIQNRNDDGKRGEAHQNEAKIQSVNHSYIYRLPISRTNMSQAMLMNRLKNCSTVAHPMSSLPIVSCSMRSGTWPYWESNLRLN